MLMNGMDDKKMQQLLACLFISDSTCILRSYVGGFVSNHPLHKAYRIARNFRGTKFSMISLWGTFCEWIFEDGIVLNPTIENCLCHVTNCAFGEMADTYEFVSVVRDYHEYQSIWSAVVREELPCRNELSNPHDLFAVAICKSDIVVGHVPRRILSICSSFLRWGGTISCKIMGPRRYSVDLLQGGLELRILKRLRDC